MFGMNRAVIYTRSFSEKKERYIPSHLEQSKHCHAYATLHQLIIISSFHDISTCDLETSRPALVEMIELAKSQSNLKILLFSKDRLAVEPLQLAHLESRFESYEAKIVDISSLSEN